MSFFNFGAANGANTDAAASATTAPTFSFGAATGGNESNEESSSSTQQQQQQQQRENGETDQGPNKANDATASSTGDPATPEKGFSLALMPRGTSGNSDGNSSPKRGLGSTALTAVKDSLSSEDVLKIVGLENQGHDWFTTEALALACTGERLGGMGAITSLEEDDIATHFPGDSLVKLLDAFPRRSQDAAPARSQASGKTPRLRANFVDEVCERLDLSDAAGRALVARFLGAKEEVGLGIRRANARRHEILRIVRRSSAKRAAVEEALSDVRSFAELDAIDSVVGLVSLSDDRFRATLQADIKLARDNSNEIVFGLRRSESLLNEVERRFQGEQSALLNVVVLMSRAAADNDNLAASDNKWHQFACEFIDERCEFIMDHALTILERKDLPENLERQLLRILFHMPVRREKKLLLRLLRPKRSSLINRVPYVSRILSLLDRLRAGYSEDLKDAVIALDAPAVSLAWAAFVADENAFSRSYAAGFESLGNVSKQTEFAHPLLPVVTTAIENFGIDELLDSESDCLFVAKLCAAAFAGRPEACDAFWRNATHTLRKLLAQFSHFPNAFLELCGALVASENSASYAYAYVGNEIRLSNLALFCSLVKHLNRANLAARFDMIKITHNVVRSHLGDPYLVETLRNLAEKFPQHVLTILANEADQASAFPVLGVIRRQLEQATAAGEYAGLLHGIDLINMLILQVEREHYSSELHVAFQDCGARCSRAELSRHLRVLGYHGSVDDATLRKLAPSGAPAEVEPSRLMQLLSLGEGAFFRVLGLSLQGRRAQTRRFVFQAVKLVREVFRSHRGWRFASQAQRWDIGTRTTRILHRCAEMPFEMDGVRAKVMDDIMNDTATQDALIANILALKLPRAVFAQELVVASLDLLSTILELDGSGTQKIALLCRQDLAATVATYIGFPAEDDRIPCEFPLQRLAVRVLENFVVSLDAFRRAKQQKATGGGPKGRLLGGLKSGPGVADGIVSTASTHQGSAHGLGGASGSGGTSASFGGGASGGVPSVVAMLSKAAMLSDDVAKSISNGETATLGLLTTSLELEPGLAAMLLQNDAILENILGILRETSNFREAPRLYLVALEFIGALWYKRYSSIIARLLDLEPFFWDLMSFSLYQDIEEEKLLGFTSQAITAQKNQICARAWALEIMTLEIETNGVSGSFMELLRTLRKQDRDNAWLKQYPGASVSRHETTTASIKSSGVDLSAFRRHASAMVMPPPNADMFLHERRQHRFGLVASQQYNVDMLERVFPDEEDLVEDVRFQNCILALSEAQLMLLRAWKIYMETRCLITWDDQPAPDDLASPMNRKTGPADSLVSRTRSLSNVASKHWGDMTSYTLVTELAANLRDADADLFDNNHQQRYLLEMAEMFTSMLHFKIFERGTSAENMKSLLLDARIATPLAAFRKRPRAMRGEKLVLDSEDPSSPGSVQLIEWISRCLNNLLNYASPAGSSDAAQTRVFTLGVMRSLLAGLLMLFEVAGDDEADVGPCAKLANARMLALDPLAKVLSRYADQTEILDLCLPLLCLILSGLAPEQTLAVKALMDQNVFGLLQKSYVLHAETLGRRYADRQGLHIWLERNGLSDLSVKVLSATAPSATNKDVAPSGASTRGDAEPDNSSVISLALSSSSQDALTIHEEEDASVSAAAAAEAEADRAKGAKEKEAESRMREIARQLGYKTFEFRSRHRSSRNYRDLVGSKISSGYSDEAGLVDMSVIHLFLDFGITSVSELRTLDHAALQEMGIYKPSDRRRLLDIIDERSGNTHIGESYAHSSQASSASGPPSRPPMGMESDIPMSSAATSSSWTGAGTKGGSSRGASGGVSGARRPISRKVGFEAAQELKRGLLRLQLILHIFGAAARVDGTGVGPHLARLNILRALATDPLLRGVAGDKPFPASMDNRDNAASITFRGYTVQGERDPAHLVWCQALELAAILLDSNKTSKENRNVEPAFTFVAAHRGAILAALQAYKSADSVLTLGALEESLRVVDLLRAMSSHTQRWRLHGELYAPLLTAAWTMLHELVVGSEGARRSYFLEEFVRTFFTVSKAVPRLCICTRPVTPLEVDQDRQPVMESLQRKPLAGTPREKTSILRTSSIIEELRESEAETAPSSRGAVISQLDDGDISVLHVTIEYRVCSVVQQLLALLRSRQIVKHPRQLQTDEHTLQVLPRRDWGKAMIPFPLARGVGRQQHYSLHHSNHYESRPRSFSHGNLGEHAMHGGTLGTDAATPSVATLLSLLGYAKYRLHLAAKMGMSYEEDRGQDLRHPGSERWRRMLAYISSNTLYVLCMSLELSLHERDRLTAQGAQGGHEDSLQYTLSEQMLEDLQNRAVGGCDKIQKHLNEFSDDGAQSDAKLMALLKSRIETTLSFFEVRSDEPSSSDQSSQSRQYHHQQQQQQQQQQLVLSTPSHGIVESSTMIVEKRLAGDPKQLMNARSGKRFRMSLSRDIVPQGHGTPEGVVIWLPGPEDHPASWEAVFRDFGMPRVRFIIPDLGLERVPEPFAPGLHETLQLPGGPKLVASMLADAAEEMRRIKLRSKQSAQGKGGGSQYKDGGKAPRFPSQSAFPAIRELFALITPRNEDRDVAVEAARLVREAVIAQLHQGVLPQNIVLGGFQSGGGFALLSALLLAMESDPIVIGFVAGINAHLSLASEVLDSLLHLLLVKPSTQEMQLPKILMRNGALDVNVTPALAEVTARALHLAGAEVNFDTVQGLDHSQWTLDQMRLVWEMVSHQMSARSDSPAPDSNAR
ncbi:Hypothetical Protein FCC1311_108402 [Hondaea fermentalgiana]|uniref:Uncharacterized protein n=1 Tax=Hondaea fermentalgiana TaxID=2315210 RepID=A0A2R5GXV1_9STRA|nr:Hypothetical Protein FCC1311_108402 [Hondaea fermentalgiana]|eukprot:GBG34618.1 Hypothetical Protein FCC1311_108402 [Hondaea fermentalgiana]